MYIFFSIILTVYYTILTIVPCALLQDSVVYLSSFIHNWKKPRRPSVGEWINRLWSIQILDYYLVLKINEL